MTTRNVQKIPEPPDLVQRLQEMTCYLPDLEDPDFWLGDIRSGQKTESGSIIMPYVVLDDVAEAFVAASPTNAAGYCAASIGYRGADRKMRKHYAAAIRLYLRGRSQCNSCT
jgi:hypothetical protein